MTLSTIALTGMVGMAGALGALSRYLLGRFIAERAASRIPQGTLIINITGAFVIGLLFALADHKLIASTLQIILATGFLGGYTTFSTMSWETSQLARGGATRLSILYLGGSMLLGLAAASLGLLMGGWL
ncbi:MAG TPA: fluoride efflux transporter CrcB [Ktedonosporobacter sp.]|nr:fluoride efflux transporter CrcB [Ktedonosporobacter sp.]